MQLLQNSMDYLARMKTLERQIRLRQLKLKIQRKLLQKREQRRQRVATKPSAMARRSRSLTSASSKSSVSATRSKQSSLRSKPLSRSFALSYLEPRASETPSSSDMESFVTPWPSWPLILTS